MKNKMKVHVIEKRRKEYESAVEIKRRDIEELQNPEEVLDFGKLLNEQVKTLESDFSYVSFCTHCGDRESDEVDVAIQYNPFEHLCLRCEKLKAEAEEIKREEYEEDNEYY